MTKRDLFAAGVWCLADQNTEFYEEQTNKSQAAIPWASQGLYAKYFTYFLICLTLCFVVKRLRFSYVDEDDRLNLRPRGPNWLDKAVAINRYVSYRRLPMSVCDYLGIPSSLGNVIVFCGSLVYVLLYTFVPHFYYRACHGFGSPPLAVRAGMGSIAFIPFILMLSGKSNLISWLVGVSYEKLNVHHRWALMICFFLALVHTIPFILQSVHEGGKEELRRTFNTLNIYWTGIPPIVFLFWLCFGFQPSFIQMSYELFYHLHWLCGLGFLISLYIHAFPLLGSQNFLYATVGFWGSQFLWRVFTKTALRPGKRFIRLAPTKARKFLASGKKDECFEMIVETKQTNFVWSPGQHVYIRIPGLRILDNHPFSICNAYSPSDEQMKLIIKPKKGLTRQIYCQIPDSITKDMKVFIDGPYGGTVRDVYAFDLLFLVTTGTGISAVMPYLMECSLLLGSSSVMLKSIRLDWVVLSEASIEWVREYLEKVPLMDGCIQVHIYDASGHEKSKFKSEVISIHDYKPDPKKLLQDISQELGNKNMIICSGSDSMKQTVGNFAASMQLNVLQGNAKVREVYLHTESFGW